MSLISIIIPVFNCERYVAAAIDSVLGQTMPPDEVIVVDDGSTDATPRVLAALSPRITFFRQPNRGAAAATNRGVEAASGRILCFLDADDLWLHDKVARQLDWLTRYPNTEAVFGHVQQFISDDLAPGVVDRGACSHAPQPGISKITMMIRREAFERIGPFDPALRSIEFLEWYTRAIDQRLRIDMLPEVVALRRLHATNSGTAMRDAQRSENLEVLKRALDRRRAASRSGLAHDGLER
jgi:glycosyltransferase involved in cell wall biosynthesis